MRVLTLTLKDLLLLWRDKFGLFWVLVFPLIYGLFFGAIAGGGDGARGKIQLAVIDEDDTETSRALVDKLAHHESLLLANAGDLGLEHLDRAAAADKVRLGRLAGYVVIKKGFGESMLRFGREGKWLEVGMDPARRAEAGFLQGILMETTFSLMGQQFARPELFRRQLQETIKQIEGGKLPAGQKETLTRFLKSLDEFAGKWKGASANAAGPFAGARIETVSISPEGTLPRSAFEITFPSAVLWAILGCMIGFAVSFVVERRQGTLLRLRLAPLSRTQLLAGKGLACFLACAGSAGFLLLVGVLFLQVRVSSVLLLMVAVACSAFCFTGLMMFLSVLGRTEQAVGGSASALMMIMAMLGGGMIPLMFMPAWLLAASNVSPVKWGIVALEGAIWRDYTPLEMLGPCAILLGVGACAFAAGVWRLARQETLAT
jgi:ABC-2 type transport system permease protein